MENKRSKILVLVTCLWSFLLLFIQYSCTKNPIADDPAYIIEERILFVRNISKKSQICTIKPDGSVMEIIAQANYSHTFVCAIWSPDKSKFLCTYKSKSSGNVTTLMCEGYKGKTLYAITGSGNGFAWSPDGKQIVFSRDKDYGSSNYDI